MQKAEREFITSLVSLIDNIRRAMDMHQDLSGSMRNPAELITGSFDGIKVAHFSIAYSSSFKSFKTMNMCMTGFIKKNYERITLKKHKISLM